MRMIDNLSHIQNREHEEFLKMKNFAECVLIVEMDNACTGIIV